AEVIFTAQTDLDVAQGFYTEIKERAAAAGRDPDAVRILPGLTPIVAETAEAAVALEDELDRYIDLETGREVLSVALQVDLSGLDPDQPIPPEMVVDPDAA